MAGHGPPPKDPARKARHDSNATTVLRHEVAEAPDLPPDLRKIGAVRNWWATWKASPQAETFGSTDWEFLLETAVIKAAFHEGDMKQAPELRLRVAKFGATPEDRARLRMQFAQADEADAKRPPTTSSRERRGTLHALPPAKVSGE